MSLWAVQDALVGLSTPGLGKRSPSCSLLLPALRWVVEKLLNSRFSEVERVAPGASRWDEMYNVKTCSGSLSMRSQMGQSPARVTSFSLCDILKRHCPPAGGWKGDLVGLLPKARWPQPSTTCGPLPRHLPCGSVAWPGLGGNLSQESFVFLISDSRSQTQ